MIMAQSFLQERGLLKEDSAALISERFKINITVKTYKAVRLSLILLVVGLVVSGFYIWITGGFDYEIIGFPILWFVSFIGAASIFLPVPRLAAVCTSGATELGKPLIIGLVAGMAETVSEMTSYLAGFSGKEFFKKNRFYLRIQGLLNRFGLILIFLGSVIPNTLFDFVGIISGSTGFPMRRFLGAVFIGKTLKSMWVSMVCMYGFDRLINVYNKWGTI